MTSLVRTATSCGGGREGEDQGRERIKGGKEGERGREGIRGGGEHRGRGGRKGYKHD